MIAPLTKYVLHVAPILDIMTIQWLAEYKEPGNKYMKN